MFMLFAVKCIFVTGGTKGSDTVNVIRLPVLDPIPGNYSPICYLNHTKTCRVVCKKPPSFRTFSDVDHFQDGNGILSSKRAEL